MIAEETRDLLRRAQAGDTAAAERMVTENTGLIWSVARRFLAAVSSRMTCTSSVVSVF